MPYVDIKMRVQKRTRVVSDDDEVLKVPRKVIRAHKRPKIGPKSVIERQATPEAGPSTRQSARAATRSKSNALRASRTSSKVKKGEKVDEGKSKGKGKAREEGPLVLDEPEAFPSPDPILLVPFPRKTLKKGEKPPPVTDRPSPVPRLPHLERQRNFLDYQAQFKLADSPSYDCVPCSFIPRAIPCQFRGWGHSCEACIAMHGKCSFVPDNNLSLYATRERLYDQIRLSPSGKFSSLALLFF